jgi:sodium-dependent dicarboxylate transporter 2/3/5
MSEFSSIGSRDLRGNIGLWLGLALAGGLQVFGVPEGLVQLFASQDVTGEAAISAARKAWIVLSLLILMAVWWISEAIPIPATALLPLIVLPLFGVLSLKQTAAEYFHPVVVLLLGGFIIAKAVERWNLHLRIALEVLSRVGSDPKALVGGFMLATALLSMWISNTATAIMMTPIALSVAAVAGDSSTRSRAFTTALLLSIAYSASIGGLGTYIGSPTNLLVKDAIEKSTGGTISFLEWMVLGVPTVVLLLPVTWLLLTRVLFKLGKPLPLEGGNIIKARLAALGPMSIPEWRTLIMFAGVATLWVFGLPISNLTIDGQQPFAGLSDELVAILGVVLCFIIPSGSSAEKGTALLDWRTAEAIPWGVVLLFGGGMALAAALTKSGLGNWLGAELSGFAQLPTLLLVLLITTIVIFVTEITSNVATAAAVMPILVSMSEQSGLSIAVIGAPVALAASCAFMLPMATGPNAVVYASGFVPVPAMAKAGLALNLAAIFLITMIAFWLAPWALG